MTDFSKIVQRFKLAYPITPIGSMRKSVYVSVLGVVQLGFGTAQSKFFGATQQQMVDQPTLVRRGEAERA